MKSTMTSERFFTTIEENINKESTGKGNSVYMNDSINAYFFHFLLCTDLKRHCIKQHAYNVRLHLQHIEAQYTCQ